MVESTQGVSHGFRRVPITQKHTYDGENDQLFYGVCEMQGWRSSMEDAVITEPYFGMKRSKKVKKSMDFMQPSLVKSYSDPAEEEVKSKSKSKSKKKDVPQVTPQVVPKPKAQVDGEWHDGVQEEESDVAIFGVYDGHGGNEVSAFIKEHLISELQKSKYIKEQRYERALEETYYILDSQMATKEGQQKLISYRAGDTLEQKKKLRFMEDEEDVGTANDKGSTAVTVLISHSQQKIIVANLGDSRAVAAYAKKSQPKPPSAPKSKMAPPKPKEVIEIKELSHDHKPQNSREALRVRQAGGVVTEDGRINGQISLSRALGDLQFKQNPKLEHNLQLVSNLCDVTLNYVNSRLRFILIACDGIWDVVSSQEACELVQGWLLEHYTECEENNYTIQPSKVLAKLFDHCLSQDAETQPLGTDNMSAVLVVFKKEPEKEQVGGLTSFMNSFKSILKF